METIDAKQQACLEGFIAECARLDDVVSTQAGIQLLEAQQLLEECDRADLPAARNWYQAAWTTYAVSRGWIFADRFASERVAQAA